MTRLVAALALICAVSGAAQAAALTPIKVSERVYYVQGHPGVASQENQGFNSNAGFVITDDGVVVVDSLGTPRLGEELIETIRSVTSQPIRLVLVTHYHADHVYGLQAFKAIGAEIWAHASAREYLEGEGEARLEERRRDLKPWVDEHTRLVPPDRWLGEETTFRRGGLTFDIVHLGPAHAPDDVVIAVREERLVFSGDIIFTGRLPFVGEADSRRWLSTIDRLVAMHPAIMVTGHGRASSDPSRDLALTRDYLLFLRRTMGQAVEDFVPFDEAYARVDWSRFARVPAFDAANRINAYGQYLVMERESLAAQPR